MGPLNNLSAFSLLYLHRKPQRRSVYSVKVVESDKHKLNVYPGENNKPHIKFGHGSVDVKLNSSLHKNKPIMTFKHILNK